METNMYSFPCQNFLKNRYNLFPHQTKFGLMPINTGPIRVEVHVDGADPHESKPPRESKLSTQRGLDDSVPMSD